MSIYIQNIRKCTVSITFTDAQKAVGIYSFRNAKEKLCRTNTAIWYVLELWYFVVIKLHADGFLVPKHAGVGT